MIKSIDRIPRLHCRDWQVDLTWITVRIDQGDRGDTKHFASRSAFFSFFGSTITKHSGQAIQRPETIQVPVDLAVLTG